MRPPGKGHTYPIRISCVAWVDLLGYGAMLEETQFRPGDAKTEHAIDRLKTFHRTAVRRAKRAFQAMPLNDGVAYFADLSMRSTSVTADFLKCAIDSHREINDVDQSLGHPGARIVIAVGPRARIGRPKRSDRHLATILQRLSNQEISSRQAVEEAFVSSPVAGFVPALQANFAFARAYLANEAGSGAQLGGPHCYVDLAILTEPPPAWITFSRRQAWSGRGLKVTFGELHDVDWRLAGRSGYAGLQHTSEVAAALGIDSADLDARHGRSTTL